MGFKMIAQQDLAVQVVDEDDIAVDIGDEVAHDGSENDKYLDFIGVVEQVKVDEHGCMYRIRFPKGNKKWFRSVRIVRKVEEIKREKLISEVGLKAVRLAKENASWLGGEVAAMLDNPDLDHNVKSIEIGGFVISLSIERKEQEF